MTSRDLAGLLLRRWYIVAIGGVLTVAALMLVRSQPPVYWTQFNVVLLPPEATPELDNKLQRSPYQLSQLAGVIATDVQGDRQSVVTASPETTLYGEGVRSGTRVRVPNLGSQFLPSFTGNYLDVQVVESSPERVTAGATEAIEKISDSLERRQSELGVSQLMRVSALPSSADPVVYQIAGNPPRAAAATAVVGMAATFSFVYWWERSRARRRTGWRAALSSARLAVGRLSRAARDVSGRLGRGVRSGLRQAARRGRSGVGTMGRGIAAGLSGTFKVLFVNGLGASSLVPMRLRRLVLRTYGVTIAGAGVAPGCTFGSPRVEIGHGSFVEHGVCFGGPGWIRVGRNVRIGFEALLMTEGYVVGGPYGRAGDAEVAPVLLSDGCWLGARVIVMPGVTVGRGAVVAAGSVVTRDCEEDGVYAGSPARLVRKLGD